MIFCIITISITLIFLLLFTNSQENKNINNNKSKEEIVYEAINKGYKLKIIYRSGQLHNNCEITERIIYPIEMKYGKDINENQLIYNSQYGKDQIYIKAYCTLRQAERHFRLDRIIELSIITK